MPDHESLPAEAVREPDRRRGAGGEVTRTLAGAVFVALLLRSFGYEPFNIPSESMLPQLLVGDYLFVAKYPYGYSRHSLPFAPPVGSGRLGGGRPERGDVAVFVTPRDNRTDFIKRVIGLPGDRVQMIDGVLRLNGVPVPKRRVADLVLRPREGYGCPNAGGADPLALAADGARLCRFARYVETLPGGRRYQVIDQVPYGAGDNTEEFVVPAGHYFMLGDNRDDSADSRFGLAQDGIGFVPEANLVGRSAAIFFSVDAGVPMGNPFGWWRAVRWERLGDIVR